MSLMKNKKIDMIMYYILGMFFTIYSIVTDNYSFIGVGMCFIVLGINNREDDNKKNKSK